MLFDLKGRRRRVVQATYLMLAVLMGGGLVFFGIGGDVSGGLFDAFSERGGGSTNSIVEDRIDDNEKRLETNPRDREALKELVRDWYALANDEITTERTYTEEGLERLGEADEAWQRYVEVAQKPEASLAALMVQAYGPTALNKPAEGARAAEIFAAAKPSAQAYLQLVQFAAQAGQKRKADLAGEKAIALAPKRERSSVRTFVKQAKQAGAAPTPQTGQ